MLNSRKAGTVSLVGHLDSTGAGARRLIDDYVAAVGRGVAARPDRGQEDEPWLQSAANVQETAPASFKGKAAYLRKRFTDRQIAAVHDHLSSRTGGEVDGSLWLVSYGGKVNTVPAGATAVAQRDSILKAV